MTTFQGADPITAIVTYSHTNPGWTEQRAHARRQQVVRLVAALRQSGIDADADLFHQNVDWSRWGPRKVAESDFVLIVASEAWRFGWLGSGSEHEHKGVRAETDVVRSIQAKGASEFQRRCRIIMLPGSEDSDIPDGMDGLMRHHIRDFATESMEPLLRDLTNQPAYELPTLGRVPVLPSAMASETPLAQLAALPEPTPRDDPAQPWYRLREEVERQLDAGEGFQGPVSSGVDEANAAIASLWQASPDVRVEWWSDGVRGASEPSALVALHLVPLPQAPLSQRVLTGLDEVMVQGVRKAGLVPANVGLQLSRSDSSISVEPERPRLSYHDVEMGTLRGFSVSRSGQVSVWYSLPRDRMGSILDEGELEKDLRSALLAGSLVLRHIGSAEGARVAVAAELAQPTLLTGGTLAELGNRNRASMPGFSFTKYRMEPDESVPVAALWGPASATVASTVGSVLLDTWRQ